MCACNCGANEVDVEKAMKAEAMGMNVDYDRSEPVRSGPPNRLDLMKEDYQSKIHVLRKDFEDVHMGTARNIEDIWSRLNRIESILGLPPIGDEGPRPGW